MNANHDDLLDRIRPRDRDRMNGLLQQLLGPKATADLSHVTVSRVGGGGEESQAGRSDPADGVGLEDWLRSILDSQATDAAPATAKVRIRIWYSGGRSGPSATVVLEPLQPAPGRAIAALPAPAGDTASQLPADSPPGGTPTAHSPALPEGSAEHERIATLEMRLAVALDGRSWYEEAHRDARATIMELERELRQIHPTLAQALADRAALQRERDQWDRQIGNKDTRIRELERSVAKATRERDQALAERDEANVEREETEDVVEQALEELRKQLGIPDDED